MVGGIVKGRRLKGSTVSGGRPTSERVRGAVFNILGPLDDKPTRVLDLYAGSGSLGIEALSRGAEWADFVENHPRQCAAIRENLVGTDFTASAKVYCMDSSKGLEVLEGPYQLVLMDPPYRLPSLDHVLGPLAGSKLLEEGSTVVVGHSKRVTLRQEYDGLEQIRGYRYGDSVMDFYEKGGN